MTTELEVKESTTTVQDENYIEISDHDREVFSRLYEQECKKAGKLITASDLSKLDSTYWKILTQFFLDFRPQILNILLAETFFEKRLQESKTKMWRIVYEAYEKDKEAFYQFFRFNFFKRLSSEAFHTHGKKVMELLREGENQHVGNVEMSVNKTYGWSLNDKYWNYVKLFFPYYQQVGVVVKKSENSGTTSKKKKKKKSN